MTKMTIIPIPTPDVTPYMLVPYGTDVHSLKIQFSGVEISEHKYVPSDMIYFINYDEWKKHQINNFVNGIIDE